MCDTTDWPVTVVQSLPWDQLLAWAETKGGDLSPEQAVAKINERRRKKNLPPLNSL